ncbi:MAG: hypothetical protein A3C22_02050 [Candidatus Levybacteria bacterium RIFCSPHIGHO2_02_FULL_37_10]|nr:MAG: hypothetical protein A3C22_02050 [Candidatus Levybacteria bacterium RIFCSPHIGHO2_02_FULL_37_10]
MNSFDVVAVGNATLDIFLWVQETNKHFRLNEETKELCIKAGDKALVDNAYLMVGGNAANVSVGLSRLGFKTSIVAEIGEDEFAQKIINSLAEEGVSEAFLQKTHNKSSSFSVIINYKSERTIFAEAIEKEQNFSFENISAKWVYLTALSEKWEEAYKKTLEFTKNNNVKLAFNPGTLQLDSGGELTEEIIKNSEIVFLNKEEAAKICNAAITNEENFIRELLLQIKNKGAKIVVITDGINGSFLIDPQNNIFFHKATDVNAVERTGAGDAYASGFLSAVLAGKNYQTAMKWGSENAASVISKVGAMAGLLRTEEMEKKENE